MSNTTVQVYTRAAGRVDGRKVELGSTEVPVSIQVGGNTFEYTATVVNGANTVIYNDQLGGFKYLAVACDYNTRLLLTDNAANTFSIQVRGRGLDNKYGVPLQFSKDQTANSSTRLTTIRAYNTSGNTAKVLCIAIN